MKTIKKPQVPEIVYKVYDKKGKLNDLIGKEEEKFLTDQMWLKGVSCFVVSKGENPKVLVETRVSKGLTPGKKDLCSGHIDNNETPTQAMVRELQEELGIPFEKAINLIAVSKNEPLPLKFNNRGGKRNFFIYFFCLKIDVNTQINFQEEEVANIDWIDLKEIFEIMREGKTKFPGDQMIYEPVFKKVEEIVFGKNLNQNLRD